jgi:signal transduction histidine kinase
MKRAPQKLRLVVAYVGCLAIGLLVLSAIAIVAVDQVLRHSLDWRLDSAVRATLAIVDVRRGRAVVDVEDRGQFLDLLGVGLDGWVEGEDGRILLSNVPRLPPVLAHPAIVTHPVTIGRGVNIVRVRAAPIVRDGRRFGMVIVWRPMEWIIETDLQIALAFALASLFIVIIASIAGTFVTQWALDDALDRQRRFTADASHELRAPLAVITAEADYALARDERSPDEYTVSLRAIQGEARRIEVLVDDLLWTARADAPRAQCALVDLGDVLAQLRRRLEGMASANGSRLSLETDAQLRAWIDGQAFDRAIVAVVHNAAKFARSAVAVQAYATARYADVAVCDDGPGFSEFGLVHATERFWREDRSRATGGNGLGLSIARSIVEACGGNLLVANRREGGAIVTLRLRALSAPRACRRVPSIRAGV